MLRLCRWACTHAIQHACKNLARCSHAPLHVHDVKQDAALSIVACPHCTGCASFSHKVSRVINDLKHALVCLGCRLCCQCVALRIKFPVRVVNRITFMMKLLLLLVKMQLPSSCRLMKQTLRYCALLYACVCELLDAQRAYLLIVS